MAYITKVSGGAQPVFATDVLNGTPAQSASLAGIPINFAGPKLDFFHLVANNSVNTQGAVNGYVSGVLQAIQQTATVAMYQVDGTGISVATFPAGAFGNVLATDSTAEADPAIFLAAAQITYPGYTLSSCTSLGFKLAAA
jgi:hypothetical protein